MPVHDVEMKPISAGFFHAMDLRLEIRKIGSENGRSDEDVGHWSNGVVE
jgi:hypothetical protein